MSDKLNPRSLKLTEIIAIGRKAGGFGVDYAQQTKDQLLTRLYSVMPNHKVAPAWVEVTGHDIWDYDFTAVTGRPQDEPSPQKEEPMRVLYRAPEPDQDPVPAPQVPATESAVEKAVRDLIAATQPQAATLDPDQVKAIVNEELAKRPQQVNEVRIMLKGDGEIARIADHTHKMFDKVVKMVNCGNNVMLKGPAGCGKTHLAEQVAKALGKTFTAVSCSGGTGEAVFEGYLLPTGEAGRFEYQESPFAKAFALPNQLILVDEFDAADANTALILNTALANRYMNIAKRVALGKEADPKIVQGEGTFVIVTANTFGTGPDAMYVGRNQMDAATLDRFFPLTMDYDKAIENGMAAFAEKQGIADAKSIVHEIHAIRQSAERANLRRVVSTRMVQKALRARSAGFEWDEIKADLLSSWTANDKQAVGV